MRLARLSLAAAALIALAACSNDATGPAVPARPAGPVLNTITIGSGLKSNSDSVMANVSTAPSTSAGTTSPI